MTDRPDIKTLIKELKTIPFLQGVDETILRELARGAVWREYEAGEVVFLEGERARGLYYLHSGWLKVTRMSAEGREQVLQFLEPGEAFNAVGVLADRPNAATAVALEPVGLWILQREAVGEMLRKRSELAQFVIQRMATRVLELVDLVADLSLRTVSGRLARLLLEDSRPGSSGEVLHRPRWYTQAEIAARLGTVPDVAQRALSALAEEGLIEVERSAIYIRDREGLEAIAT
ncbi:MAG: Crp/Fnr family transcriptional regulator [Chloroflexota bacterium]